MDFAMGSVQQSALPQCPFPELFFESIHHRCRHDLGEDNVPLHPQETLRSSVARPFRSRMGCHVEVPAIMDEHNEDKQNFKPHGVHGEEVDRSQLRYVIAEERSPRLRWWLRMAD